MALTTDDKRDIAALVGTIVTEAEQRIIASQQEAQRGWTNILTTQIQNIKNLLGQMRTGK